MGVKVDDSDRSVGLVHATQKWQSDGVVASKRDDTRQCLTVLGDTCCLSISCWLSHEDAVVPMLDLFNGPSIVVAILGQQRLWTGSFTYDVTGMSPQSMTVAQLLKGFAARGTLYPPLPFVSPCSQILSVCLCSDVLEIETATTLSDT